MRFALEITTDNSAFDSPAGNGPEIARILRDVADHVDRSDWTVGDSADLLDANGNRVGLWRLFDQ